VQIAWCKQAADSEIKGRRHKSWPLCVEHGLRALCLRRQLNRTLDPGPYELDPQERILLCRGGFQLSIEFDDLTSQEGRLLLVCLTMHFEVTDLHCFHGVFGVDKDSITDDDLKESLAKQVKQTLQNELHQYPENDLPSDRVRCGIAICLTNSMKAWCIHGGLKVNQLDIVQLAKRATLEDLRKLCDGVLLKQSDWQRAKHDYLAQSEQESRFKDLERVVREAENWMEFMEKIVGMRAALKQKEESRCQLCGLVFESKDLASCSSCGRQLCAIHFVAEDKVCEKCKERQEEAERRKLSICPGCGRYVTKEQMFQCRQCQNEFCTEYCFDRAKRLCHECTSNAQVVQHAGEESPLRKAVSESENRKQPFFTRVWCDRRKVVRGATRGIEVVPKTDVRRFQMGEQLQLKFWSDRDCWLYILDVQSDGSVVQLLPNSFHEETFVAGMKELRIPDEHMAFDYCASQPVGVDTIVAIAALEKFDMPAEPEGSVSLQGDDSPGSGVTKGFLIRDAVSGAEALWQALKRLDSTVYSCAVCKIIVDEKD
jgi:hypothetical protein